MVEILTHLRRRKTSVSSVDAPQTQPRPDPGAARESEGSSGLSIRLTRHDHHNLELKTRFDLGADRSRGNLEIFLFLPGSVQLRSAAKPDLISDFHSRARLSFARDAQGDPRLLEQEIESLRRRLAQIAEAEARTSDWADPSSPAIAGLLEKAFSECRRLGAVYGETIRHIGSQHKRRLLLIHSRAAIATDPSAELIELTSKISAIARQAEDLRAICKTTLQTPVPALSLLEQYISQIYVHYLAGLRAELDKMRAAEKKLEAERFEVGWAAIESMLNELQSGEARTGAAARAIDDEIERELHLVRLSHMKKFFQSDMFVDVARRESLKKFSEPLAAGAAAFAALWAALFERLARPNWMDVGFQGLSVICLGIAVYVFRDRFKDILRQFVTNRLSRVLPDIEQELVAEGKQVGKISEWFSVKSFAALSENVKTRRHEACVSEAEKHLPEDVLHYRRIFSLNEFNAREASGGEAGSSWALQEILRICLARWLKHLDDPFKTYSFLDSAGGFSFLRSHRVYHFHLCVEASLPTPNGETRRYTQFYRIVMDKNGIDRVEQVG